VDCVLREDEGEAGSEMEMKMMAGGYIVGRSIGKYIAEEKLENSPIVQPKQERKGAGIAIANTIEKLNATLSSPQIINQEEAVQDRQVSNGDILT